MISTEKRTISVAIVLLAVTILLVYSQTALHDFIAYDDNYYILLNEHVRTGVNLKNIMWAFTTGYVGNWHPITWLSHMLDVQIFGLNPAGHHAVNVVLHTANTLLLFSVLRRSTGLNWQSLFVAALFGLHPLHVESTAWVAERKDVLSTLFWLLTMLLYERYTANRDKRAYILALTTFVLGLMSKPMLVTLPFVLLLWDIWPLGRMKIFRWESGQAFLLLKEKAPFFLLSLVSCCVTFYVQHAGGTVAAVDAVPITSRLVNAVISYVQYIVHMFWPINLAIIYPWPDNIPILQGCIAFAALLAISYLVYRNARNNAYLVTGWLWFLGTLVPVIGLVQVGQQAYADRYTYIPLIGLFIIIAWGVPELTSRLVPNNSRRFLVTLSMLLIIALTICTWFQVGYWKNSLTVFTHAGNVVKNNYLAYRYAANVLNKQGKFDDALYYLQKAVPISPNNDLLYSSMGIALAGKGMFDEAEYNYQKSLSINKENIMSLYGLGLIQYKKGNFPEAIRYYVEALKLNPDHVDIKLSYAVALFKTGNLSESSYRLNEVLSVEPANHDALYNLGLIYALQGNLPESIVLFSRALASNPNSVSSHYNIALAYLKTGNKTGALQHFNEALRIQPTLEPARRYIESIRAGS